MGKAERRRRRIVHMLYDILHACIVYLVFDYCAHNIPDLNDQQCQNVPLICLQRAAMVQIMGYGTPPDSIANRIVFNSIYIQVELLWITRRIRTISAFPINSERRRRHTQVEVTSPHKNAGNSKTITLKRWHGARIY